MIYISILLHCIDLTLEFLRRISATSFTVPLLDTISLHVSTELAIFRCTGVVNMDSAAHSNAAFFPPIVVISGYFGYVGCTWLLMVLFDLLVVAAFIILIYLWFI
jgi:hypothetical protein